MLTEAVHEIKRRFQDHVIKAQLPRFMREYGVEERQVKAQTASISFVAQRIWPLIQLEASGRHDAVKETIEALPPATLAALAQWASGMADVPPVPDNSDKIISSEKYD